MNTVLYQTSHDEGRINAQGQYEYNITDHNNDLRVAFRDSLGIAVPTQSIFYDPWGLSMKGMQITRNPTNFNKYQFLNRETQFETGLVDLMRRQYDPQTGRFVSIDPVTDGQEHLSLYQYGWNNPILKPDPNGDCPLCPAIPFLPEIGAGLAAAGEYIVGTAVGVAILATVEKNADKIARGIESLATSGAMGTEHQYANWAKALDPSSVNSKKVPNPDGKNGGKPHQETNKKEADRMRKEGKDVEKEVMVKTPDGKKSKRFVDQTGTDPKTGKKEMVQVGKQNKNGTPVKRERDAMDDIEKATGQRPTFVPYNRK